MDVCFGSYQTGPISAAGRIQFQDAIDQFHAAGRQPERFRKGNTAKMVAKAPGQVAFPQCLKRHIIIAFGLHWHKL